MHFGFALELSGIDLWNIDLLDTHLDLLDTDIPISILFHLHNIFKMSSRHPLKNLQEMSSRHLQDMFSRRLVTLKSCWRRLQDQQMFGGRFHFNWVLISIIIFMILLLFIIIIIIIIIIYIYFNFWLLQVTIPCV